MRLSVRVQLLIAAMLLAVAIIPPAQAKVTAGEPLPGIKLLTWEGQSVNLRDLRGKVLVIDFWASWCMPCRQALPALEALNQRYAGAPIAVVAINIDRERAAAEHFLSDYLPGHSMMLLRDPQADALARFGADGMPAIYVVDPNGIVRFAESGYAPEAVTRIADAVNQYLPQRSMPDQQPASDRRS